MSEVEVAREEVLHMLPELSELQLDQVVTGLTLTVKEVKGKGSRKSVLLNTIRRYITSEEVDDQEDQGLAMLGKLHDELEQKLSTTKKDKEADEVETVVEKVRMEWEERLAKMKEEIRLEVESGVSSSKSINITKEALEDLLKRESWNRSEDTVDARLKALFDKQTGSKSDGNTSKVDLHSEDTIDARLKALLDKQTVSKSDSNPKVDLHKFKIKEFKINGTVGGENETDYSGLMYQVKEGRKLGYSEEEIQLGIVKVIKDKTLKKFFEICTDMTSEDFYGMLKNHYDVKDSTTLLEDMVSSVQEPKENMLKFVMRMYNIRNTIVQVTKDEDCPLGVPIIQKQFVRSVLVGLRKPTSRLELQPLFERKDLSDLEILKEVKEIMKKDEENAKKMGKSSNAGVNSVDSVVNSVELKELLKTQKDGKVVEEAILEQISNLTAQMEAFAGALELLKQELKNVKQMIAKGDDEEDTTPAKILEKNGWFKTKFGKCQKCEKSGVFCTHCSICGSGGHKKRDCPKNE